ALPDGYAARAETIPATAFTTSPDFAAIAASSRGRHQSALPDGYAARAETIPATAFTTSPDFAAIAASSR
ncbi:hypothetical protein CJ738_36575, partial [Klebsiella pneumoniae]